ncbi:MULTISPECIES: tetratricopeptide repeat protein [unclassified Flavobacterium]|uniref:tetratricopeptide repeat protein n=1 Tax=unclassified Flavobacterium TaxID=196869 RepID=UPI003F8ED945
MRKSIFLYLLVISFISANMYSQHLNKVNFIEEKSVSVNPVNTYENVIKKGYKSAVMFEKLANRYYFNNEMNKAVKCYGELFAIESNSNSEYYFRYSIALKAIGQIDKATIMMQKFAKLTENETTNKEIIVK